MHIVMFPLHHSGHVTMARCAWIRIQWLARNLAGVDEGFLARHRYVYDRLRLWKTAYVLLNGPTSEKNLSLKRSANTSNN